jgi:2-keto-3-deoxy-L-rhamnonate aldolase RhmA
LSRALPAKEAIAKLFTNIDHMIDTPKFIQKLRQGRLCLGTCITFTDPTVTEALTNVCDFAWIDMEHNALSLEAVLGHVLACKGTNTTPLVRVAWNDPVLIKPVLDIGAAGVIVPLVRTADDVRRAVAACRYPPEGIRGFGPRRPSNYARLGGPEFCRASNETIITIAQIEHIEAVEQIDELLAVPGLSAVVVGPNDLSGSMGQMGNPRHPDVLAAIDRILERAKAAGVFAGVSVGDDPDILVEWVKKGANWVAMGADFTLLLRAATEVAQRVRAAETKA